MTAPDGNFSGTFQVLIRLSAKVQVLKQLPAHRSLIYSEVPFLLTQATVQWFLFHSEKPQLWGVCRWVECGLKKGRGHWSVLTFSLPHEAVVSCDPFPTSAVCSTCHTFSAWSRTIHMSSQGSASDLLTTWDRKKIQGQTTSSPFDHLRLLVYIRNELTPPESTLLESENRSRELKIDLYSL